MKEGDLLKFLLNPLFTDTESDKLYLIENGIEPDESKKKIIAILKMRDEKERGKENGEIGRLGD